MQWNVYFAVQSDFDGTLKTSEVPNLSNPMEAASLEALLVELAANLPRNDTLAFSTVGIRVEPVQEVTP